MPPYSTRVSRKRGVYTTETTTTTTTSESSGVRDGDGGSGRSRTRRLTKTNSPKPQQQDVFMSQKITQIFNAAEIGNVENLETLVKLTGPAITRAKTGCTLLHAAAANNQSEMVYFLLKLISPNIVNKEGQTPVHLAAMKGHTQALRMLVADVELNHDKLDNSLRTYMDYLAVPLFEAVLWWNRLKIQELLKLGADPDYHAGKLVEGMLSRELQVTTARQLALTLDRESIVRMFPKPRVPENLAEVTTKAEASSSRNKVGSLKQDIPLGPLRLMVKPATGVIIGPDVYNMVMDPRGYVCILNYSSFKDRPDLNLDGSQQDAYSLANVFRKMGYTGHCHSSLTTDQTIQVLTSVRDMEVLELAGCAMFIISSHGKGQEEFLTSDMEHLTTDWICNLFKDSECPRLKGKPKLFIFDFCCGYYESQTPSAASRTKYSRVTEPLQDIMCLYSSNGDFTSYSFTKDGTPFIRALCRTLAQHAHDKELSDLYREFLKEYNKTSPTSSPQLRNIGFTKKLYFSPTSVDTKSAGMAF